jgi:hypothetical protein
MSYLGFKIAWRWGFIQGINGQLHTPSPEVVDATFLAMAKSQVENVARSRRC